MYAPTLGLQRSAHARGAGKGIVGRAYLDPTPLQGSKNEWKEPGFVADVPHDAPCASLDEPLLETAPGANGKSGPPGPPVARLVEWKNRRWH